MPGTSLWQRCTLAPGSECRCPIWGYLVHYYADTKWYLSVSVKLTGETSITYERDVRRGELVTTARRAGGARGS